ncbi:MAG: LD-carboxypeptidase [Syntrophobacteraceae bacterium]
MILKSTGPGSSIALIAPSSPFEADLFEKGREILDSAGYRTVPGKSIFSSAGYLAGADLERANDLSEALLDPEIGAVICIRGGYGSGRLLPWLNFSALRKNPKIFIGHSDITFLHLAFFSRMGWTTLHGPNLTGMAEAPEKAENVLRALSGAAAFEWRLAPEQILRRGAATGPVLGGNLTCLAHLVGTPYLPDMTGALLLIEDCGEALYRLDRIITHLKLAGILPKLGGILLGEFDNCAENGKICEMVLEHVRSCDFPVVHGLPFGHGRRNEVIPFGAPFLLDTHEGVLRVLDAPIAG